MRKALFKNNIIIFISAFLMFLIVAFLLLYNQNSNNQTHFMNVTMNEVEISFINYEDDFSHFVIDYKGTKERRLTILNQTGIVLADSHDEEIGTNKSHRPEIITTNKVFIRKSDTINENMMYLARVVQKDGTNYYLRIAVFVEPGLARYQVLFLTFFLIGITVIIAHLIAIKKISDRLLSPWQQVINSMKMLREGKHEGLKLINDPDIDPVLREIHQVHLDILKQVKTIENYQNRLNRILNELKQGVLLFNNENKLLYFNDDARKIFNLTDDALNKPVYYQIRDLKIREIVEDLNSNKEDQKTDFIIDGKTYEILSFQIESISRNKGESTKLLIFKDVSEERKVQKVKEDFFANTSHELKSPLTAIKGNAELIEHKLLKSEEEIIESARQITKQTELMNLLIEDMLILSRLEGMPKTVYANESISSILDQVLENLSTEIQNKEIKLHKDIKTTMFNCDSFDIHKLFKNLIENAVKYSDFKQSIEVKLYQKNEKIIFSVKDNGIGIDNSHQERIFERFYRVDKGRINGGTGLGLAIVKHIVLKYKGKIDVYSKLGEGSLFVIELPIF